MYSQYQFNCQKIRDLFIELSDNLESDNIDSKCILSDNSEYILRMHAFRMHTGLCIYNACIQNACILSAYGVYWECICTVNAYAF